MENDVAVTGENGCTPGKDQEKAVLLTEMMKQATDTPNTPKTTEYSYTITAEVNGQKAVINNYKPERSWQNIRITLK